MKMTLAQALQHAATAVHMDRRKADEQFGAGLYDRAIEHHTRGGLCANLKSGVTRCAKHERSGPCAGYEGASQYEAAPHLVYFDFFRGHVMNSVSRMARGLAAW